MPDRIRVVTYNVHKCRGMDRRVRPMRIVEVLHEIDADVVALQEVLGVSGRLEEDHAQFIARELGLYSCMGENRRLHGGAYGNLLLSRFPLRAVQNHDISTPGREHRGCLRVDVELPETTLHVFNLHLGTGFFERRQQIQKLLSPTICTTADFVARGSCWEISTSGPTVSLPAYSPATFKALTSGPICAVPELTPVYSRSYIWITSISIRR